MQEITTVFKTVSKYLPVVLSTSIQVLEALDAAKETASKSGKEKSDEDPEQGLSLVK